MRSLRWLLLVAIILGSAAVLAIYQVQRREQNARRQPPPAPIPLHTVGSAIDFEWAQSDSGKPAVHVFAKDSKQLDNNKNELEQVELRIYEKDAQHYDRVRSPQ